MDRRAGRGDLSAGKPGGWDEALQDEVRRWGAGEDFFAVADLEVGPEILQVRNMVYGILTPVVGGAELVLVVRPTRPPGDI